MLCCCWLLVPISVKTDDGFGKPGCFKELVILRASLTLFPLIQSLLGWNQEWEQQPATELRTLPLVSFSCGCWLSSANTIYTLWNKDTFFLSLGYM